VEAEWGGSFGGGSSGGGFGEAEAWRWIWRRRTQAEALAEVSNRKTGIAVFSITIKGLFLFLTQKKNHLLNQHIT
jgi:hypothetical protein